MHRVTFSKEVALDICITTGEKRLHDKHEFVNGWVASQ